MDSTNEGERRKRLSLFPLLLPCLESWLDLQKGPCLVVNLQSRLIDISIGHRPDLHFWTICYAMVDGCSMGIGLEHLLSHPFSAPYHNTVVILCRNERRSFVPLDSGSAREFHQWSSIGGILQANVQSLS